MKQVEVYFEEIKRGLQEREDCVKQHLSDLHHAEKLRLVGKLDGLEQTLKVLDNFDAFEYSTENQIKMLKQTQTVEMMEHSLLNAKETSEFFTDKIESAQDIQLSEERLFLSRLIASNFKLQQGNCGHLFPAIVSEPRPTSSHLYQHTASTANKLRKVDSVTLLISNPS